MLLKKVMMPMAEASSESRPRSPIHFMKSRCPGSRLLFRFLALYCSRYIRASRTLGGLEPGSFLFCLVNLFLLGDRLQNWSWIGPWDETRSWNRIEYGYTRLTDSAKHVRRTLTWHLFFVWKNSTHLVPPAYNDLLLVDIAFKVEYHLTLKLGSCNEMDMRIGRFFTIIGKIKDI